MSVLSRLTAALTAKELQTPLSGTLSGHLTVNEALSLRNDAQPPKTALRSLPTHRPWCQAPSPAPTTLSLVEMDNGEAPKVIDLVYLAWRRLDMVIRGELEESMSEQWDRKLSDISMSSEMLSSIDVETSAFDVATKLGEVEENLILVTDHGKITGFITFESLQQPAFTLPLFGLLMELEEAALQWMELKPRDCWQMLSEGRRRFAKERAQSEFIKLTRHIESTGIRSIPLMFSLNAWLFPEKIDELLKKDCDEAGAPIELALQMTTFIDKGTVLRKSNAISSLSKSQTERFWKKAEDVRNCIAHGRAWWLEIPSSNELMTFIASCHEMLTHIAAAIGRDRNTDIEATR